MTTIGERIKEERNRLGFSQEKMAEIAGVTRASQIKYEGNKRNPDSEYLTKIASAGVDIQYVLVGNHLVTIRSEFDPQTLAIARMVKELDPAEKNGIESFVSDKKFIHELKQREMRQSA